MKIAFFLLIPFLSFSQITQRDTVVSIGGTLYLQHIVTTTELLVDTFAIRARINEIDAQVAGLQAEKEKKKALIADFEEKKPASIKPLTPKKQPARKPKNKKQ